MFNIIKADQRKAEAHGAKILVAGRPGVGKTSLLRTLDLPSTLFVDNEAGDLAVKDLAVDTVQPKMWPDMVNLACWLGGPNPAMATGTDYSVEHYNDVISHEKDLPPLDKYQTFFIDSITEMSRVCFRWAQQQPSSFNKHGVADTLSAYGLLARSMMGWLSQVQHARGKNVVFVGILENVKDAYGVPFWDIQIEGGKTGRELPGIVDEVIVMEDIDFDGKGQTVKCFICHKVNPYLFPAKDRSGRLDLYEEPDLGALIRKVTGKEIVQPAAPPTASEMPEEPSRQVSKKRTELIDDDIPY